MGIAKLGKNIFMLSAGIFMLLLIVGINNALSTGGINDCHIATNSQEKATAYQEINASNDNWQSVNANITEGADFLVTPSGDITLCKGTGSLSLSEDQFVSTDATNNSWQATGVYVREGARAEFDINEKFSIFPSSIGSLCANDDNPLYTAFISDLDGERVFDSSQPSLTRQANTGRWNDSGSADSCYSQAGKGIFVHIGEPDGGLDSSDFGNPAYEGVGDRFFELFDYIQSTDSSWPELSTQNGTFNFSNSPASGQIYIRYGYVDTSIAGPSNDWQWPTPSQSLDYRGGYDIKITSDCEARNGEAMMVYFGDSAPTSDDSEGILANAEQVLSLDSSSILVYRGTAPSDGTLYFKILDTIEANENPASGDGIYGNNTGNYVVKVEYSTHIQGNDLLNEIIEPVKILLHGAIIDGEEVPGVPEAFFSAITANGLFIDGLRACLVLAIAFYGFNYVVSNRGGSLEELITFAFRFGIIIALTSDTSWEFFYTFLFQGIMQSIDSISALFIAAINPGGLGYADTTSLTDTAGIYDSTLGGLTDQINADAIGTNQAPDVSARYSENVFSFLSVIINFLMLLDNWYRVASFATRSIAGFGLVLVFIFSIFLFFLTVFRVLATYLTTMLILAILIGVSPIFISMLLFSYTRSFTNKWFRATIFYTLLPIMLLSLISLFSVLYFSFIHAIFHFSVCFECVYSIDITFLEEFCLIANYVPWELDSQSLITQTASDFVTAISLAIIATSMYSLPALSHGLAIRIAQSAPLADPGDTSNPGSMAGRLGLSEQNQGLIKGVSAAGTVASLVSSDKDDRKAARKKVMKSIPIYGDYLKSKDRVGTREREKQRKK